MDNPQAKKLALCKETIRDLLDPVSAVAPKDRREDGVEAYFGGRLRRKLDTGGTYQSCWGSCDYACIP